jgi:hypothetical protein
MVEREPARVRKPCRVVREDRIDELFFTASGAKTGPIGLRSLTVVELEHATEPLTAWTWPRPIAVILGAMS